MNRLQSRSAQGTAYSRGGRLAAFALVLGLAVGSLGTSLLGLSSPAIAETNEPEVPINNSNTFYTYSVAGETVEASFTKVSNVNTPGAGYRFQAFEPSGTLMWTCTVAAADPIGTTCAQSFTTTSTGAWKITSVRTTTNNSSFSWSINALSGGVPQPGRVWANLYNVYQSGPDLRDLTYYLINDSGYRYTVNLYGYNGVGSIIRANSLGNTTPDCVPIYQSIEGAPFTCGTNYRIFFEQPAADLPVTTPSPDGVLTVAPTLITEADLEVDDMAFTPGAPGTAAGTFTFSIDPRFQGGYKLQIDTNGDGVFTDPTDRSIQLGADGSGSYEYDFDGLDGLGDPVADCALMNARILFDMAGEIHILQQDVEGRNPGIELVRTNGSGSPDDIIRWNDTNLSAEGRANVTPQLDGRAGVASTGGVHGWPYAVNSWGDARTMDDWAVTALNVTTGEIALGGRCLTVTKTSDATADTRPGDTVNYTVTATNAGSEDYTDAQPATLTDDLTDVLTNATYGDDAIADQPGTITFATPKLNWTGALAAGQTVTLQYSAVVTGGGDGRLHNVAYGAPPDTATPSCDQTTGDRDPTTNIPCGTADILLPRLTIEKTANTQELPRVGDSITYTVTATNVGPGAFTAAAPATVTDDLSAVLDDATFEGEATASVGSPPVFQAPNVTWSGALQTGQSVTLTYSVTYRGTGDSSLVNLACVPEEDTEPGAESCATVTVPAGNIRQWKTVEASSDPILADTVLTYTLHFQNTGGADAPVAATDDMSGVLDDAAVTEEPHAVTGPLSAARVDSTTAITGTLAPGETSTIEYTVSVKADGERGDNSLVNFLLAPGQNPPEDRVCDPFNPDFPSCTESPVALPDIQTWKTVEPSSGKTVVPGQTLRYTLHFYNAGDAPGTVDVADDITHAIDDATVVRDPESAGGLTASPFDDTNRSTITGTLAAGETVTMSYEMRVRPADELGDRVLTNFLVVSTAPTPPDPECSDTSTTPSCTSNPVVVNPAPPNKLVVTGASTLGLGLVALLVAALGGVFTSVRRR